MALWIYELLELAEVSLESARAEFVVTPNRAIIATATTMLR
jgi:hypothetical protein